MAEAQSVLIVEDDRCDADLLRGYLQGAGGAGGLDITVVELMEDALSALRTRHYDVTFTDLSLPDSFGLDTVTDLRKANQETALVVLTGAEDEDLAIQVIQSGAQDYLMKGEVNERTVKRAIRYALERVRSEVRLRQLAHFDGLTGLANRITFCERLSQVADRSRRASTPFAIMLLDLDRFKAINDTHGHEVGDLILQEVAARMRGATRAYDTVARLGGDEFAILSDDVAGKVSSRSLAERILAVMREPIVVHGQELVMTTSIGIAEYPDGGTTPLELMRTADAAMYEAKATGRNGYHVFEVGSSRMLPNRRMQTELQRAVASREFFLHYQPQYDLATGAMVGLEALLRWRRADGTMCLPGEFIGALEDAGLIAEAGAWALRTACNQLSAFDAPFLRRLRVAVNLSAHQLNDELPRVVEQALRESQLDPSRLELEVTESILMRDTPATDRALQALRDLGVRIAIDDFGTGYSSLAYLNRLQVNALKVDRTFVQRLGDTRSSQIVTSAVVGLAHRLGLEVVAEGVETESQLQFLREEGCDIVQGYLFARPGELSACLDRPTSSTSSL